MATAQGRLWDTALDQYEHVTLRDAAKLGIDDGAVLAFEVKAKERISGADFNGLRKLREALGDRLIAGVALNTGVRSYTFEDRLHVMPLDRLWLPVGR